LNQELYGNRYGTFFLGRDTTGHFKKQPVLIALDRMLEKYSEETMIELADVIYEQRMTNKDAIKIIRQFAHIVPLPTTV
jgi:hypothetical protein